MKNVKQKYPQQKQQKNPNKKNNCNKNYNNTMKATITTQKLKQQP